MSANQSRRRTDLGSSLEGSTKPKTDNRLPYQGGELDKNSLRLVEIQPAAHESDPVVCTLSEVTFGSKPKFEALSYMWGTEKADDAITLNGHPFEVGKNLLDALHFLRSQAMFKKTCHLFWIDAICINQSDVEERNRQVRIMDQIYFRADTVVVWLGSKYSEFQREMISELKLEESEKLGEGSPQIGNSTQQKMVRHLRTDPYWDRLWILQEIGKAWQLRVCYGNETFSWDDFMNLMMLHNGDGATGPLRLDRLLRKEKYNDSHTLKRLLEEHRTTKCSEPRDKVYGLIGLASDAGEFPIDYKKSLYEVWKDTMEFMNKWNLFQDESQILPIGGLVKSLLMANHGDPLSQLSKEHKDQVDSTQLLDNPKSPLVFRLKAAAIGCIVCVGPSANDVVSGPDEATRWRTATQRLFPADELGSAHQEYDKLLHALLESDESEVEKACFNRPSPVVWEQRNTLGYQSHHLESVQDYIRRVHQVTKTTTFKWKQKPQEVTDRLAPVQPRLYLAKDGNRTQRKMGLASSLVQQNDVVFRVPSAKRALLVRVVQEEKSKSKARVVGTALTTKDMCSSTPDNDYTGWTTTVHLDAGTLFMLLDNTHRSTLVEIFGLRLGLLSPNLPPDGNQHQTKNHSTATLIVTNLPESVKRIYTYTRTSMKKPNSPEAKPQPHALDPAEKRRLQNRRAQHNYRRREAAKAKQDKRITKAVSARRGKFLLLKPTKESFPVTKERQTPPLPCGAYFVSARNLLLSADHRLLTLVHNNIIRGLAANASLLNYPWSTVCQDDALSNFSPPPPNLDLSITQPSLPVNLHPTPLQYEETHHPWLDLIPSPQFRDNLLRRGICPEMA
ncbi:hypothetical protein CI102_13571 [Trichoderma harzianum]|nr:hypothetical protein CI102_13571 [Trichoderma harzianum]